MDLTGGTRKNLELRQALQVPTLSDAIHPEDTSAIPVPDPFILSAVLTASGNQAVIPEHFKDMGKRELASFWLR